MNRDPHPWPGAQPAPTPIPSYLQLVFDTPELLNRAAAIATILSDEPQDGSLTLLALLAQRETGWTRQLLNTAGWILLHKVEYSLSVGWEARAAA